MEKNAEKEVIKLKDIIELNIEVPEEGNIDFTDKEFSKELKIEKVEEESN